MYVHGKPAPQLQQFYYSCIHCGAQNYLASMARQYSVLPAVEKALWVERVILAPPLTWRLGKVPCFLTLLIPQMINNTVNQVISLYHVHYSLYVVK